MYYHAVAVNVPLYTLFTYQHATALAVGTRVVVPFRGKKVVGIVWQTPSEEAPTHLRQIYAIERVFHEEPPLPEHWRQLIDFAARYYHYPIGQTIFTALPSHLREPKPCPLPEAALYYQLNALGKAQAAPPAHHRRQAQLWQALHEPITIHQAKSLHSQAASLLEKWQQHNWLAISAPPQTKIAPSSLPLNPAQQAAVNSVGKATGFAPFLLFGITGSGKTEVYFDIMAKVLAEDKQVLFLLPEINLTPQLAARLQTRFAHVPTAILHSQTAAGERSTNYQRALSGDIKLVVGTRLAVFTPLPDLGLIIVDEEHDQSFKQDNELRYQARDLAVWRAQNMACPIVLGSATPSLESWQHTQTGHYHLLTLPERAHQAARLPEIQLLDIRRSKLQEGLSPIALQLLQENQANGGMSMVYLNRRGFAPAIFCSNCGHTFGCPHCSAKMVLHQAAHHLRCHHCGYSQAIPLACPECGNQDLTALGFGTQRVELALRQTLPEAKIVRVDRDSTSKKQDWQTLYTQINAGEVDILLGTQMLAKGHDFARLNLVIVVNADGSLYSADFRAPEYLFAEMMQVAGRAGRANHQGRVFVQTRFPEHKVFQALKAQSYPQFAQQELAERQTHFLPPFCYQVAIRADAPQLADAMAFLSEAAQIAEINAMPPNVMRLGPVAQFMVRLAQRERAQVFLECDERKTLHQAIALWQQTLIQLGKSAPTIRWSIDVDCYEI